MAVATPARRQGQPLLEWATAAAFAVLAATLTLEWMTLGGVLGGTLKPFHLVAVVFVGLVGSWFSLTRVTAPILRRFGVIYIAWILYLLIATGFSQFHTTPYASSKDLLRQTTYSFTGLVVAGWFMLCITRPRVRRVLVWCGLASCIVVSLGLYTSLRSQGGAPVPTIKEAISKGDPDVIGQQLLKTAFESNEDFEDAKVNLRHKIASALLLGIIVSLAVRSRDVLRSPLRRVLFWAAVAYGFAVVVFTFSRSITVALGCVLLLNGIRALVVGRARPGHAAAIAAVVIVAVAALLSPLGDLLYTRFFEETGSYTGRTTALGLFLEDAPEAALVGIDATDAQAVPHNAILDAWLSAGVVGATLSTIAIGALVAVWLRELRRYLLAEPGWVLPLNHFWVVALAVTPLVRVFTAANGFHLTEWTAVGAFLGCLEANRRRRALLERQGSIDTDHPTRRTTWTPATTATG